MTISEVSRSFDFNKKSVHSLLSQTDQYITSSLESLSDYLDDWTETRQYVNLKIKSAEPISEEFIDPNDQHEKDTIGLLANHL